MASIFSDNEECCKLSNGKFIIEYQLIVNDFKDLICYDSFDLLVSWFNYINASSLVIE